MFVPGSRRLGRLLKASISFLVIFSVALWPQMITADSQGVFELPSFDGEISRSGWVESWQKWRETRQLSSSLTPSAKEMADNLYEQVDNLEEQVSEWSKRRAFVEGGLNGEGESIGFREAVASIEAGKTLDSHPYLDPEFHLALDSETDSQLTAGNRMTLLANHQSWDVKSELMGVAKKSLYVTAMIMRCDSGGKDFSAHMIEAAQRGVDTRFILDKLFSFYAYPCLREMQEGGVNVVLSARSVQPATFDWEMHEKLVIIDGEVGFIGGQNVGSWYQEATGTDSYYRDTDMMLTGPIVLDLADRFIELWREWRPMDIPLAIYKQQIQEARLEAQAVGLTGTANYANWLGNTSPSGLCRFVAQDPHLGTFHVWTAYEKHIEAARKRVMLTAYALDPMGSWQQESFREALVNLAERPGAKVDVITNGLGVLESEVVPAAFRRSYAKSILNQAYDGLGKTGVQIWTYKHFVHAKQYYFDGLAVGVGSFNYDASGNRCQESVVICIDPALSKDMGRLFALDLSRSTQVHGLEASAQSQP